MKKYSMQKKIESLKKNEDSARPYMNRLYCLVEQGYIDWATIGEYLARGLSEDMVEKAYGWMKQDELIPTDDALEEDGLEWDEDGELVSIENDESKKKEAFNSYNDIEDFVKEHVSYRALADDITQMGIAAKSLAKQYNLNDTRGPARIKLRNKIRDEIEKNENFEQAKAHILRIVDAIVDEDGELVSIETDESKKQEYRVKSINDSMASLEKQGFDRGFLQDIALEMYDMGCSQDFITRHFDSLNDDGLLTLYVKKGYSPYQIADKLANMGA